MKKFLGTARRPSYSLVNSYARDCGSWMLIHFDRIHWSRSDDVMKVHLFGSTSCGYPNRCICGIIMKLFGRVRGPFARFCNAGRSDGACSLVHLQRQRPSLCNSQVGSCNYCFGACSVFTHVMACTLAESPSDPFHRELRQLCCLRRRFDCYRVERTSSRAGVTPAEVQRLFTAHCYAN